jgi:hypothetical protein
MKKTVKFIITGSIFATITFFALNAFASIISPLQEFTHINAEPLAMISVGFIFIGIAGMIRRKFDQRQYLNSGAHELQYNSWSSKKIMQDL